MKPCDCLSQWHVDNCLNEAGIKFNDDSITVCPNYVVLKMGHTKIKIHMPLFKRFAEWYLTNQDTN
jgi:hypothetical protein